MKQRIFGRLKLPKNRAKAKFRRSKANARERNRMHQLNDAFDNLRRHIPIIQCLSTADYNGSCGGSDEIEHQYSPAAAQITFQKLSKIETLRLAKNYIAVLMTVLQDQKSLSILELFSILTRQLSQSTANSLKSRLKLDAELQHNLLNFAMSKEEYFRRDSDDYLDYSVNYPNAMDIQCGLNGGGKPSDCCFLMEQFYESGHSERYSVEF